MFIKQHPPSHTTTQKKTPQPLTPVPAPHIFLGEQATNSHPHPPFCVRPGPKRPPMPLCQDPGKVGKRSEME